MRLPVPMAMPLVPLKKKTLPESDIIVSQAVTERALIVSETVSGPKTSIMSLTGVLWWILLPPQWGCCRISWLRPQKRELDSAGTPVGNV